MKAEKGNKVYTVDESTRARYEADGFDIKDDSGNLISTGKGKTVPYQDYQKVLDELNKLKANAANKESGDMDEFSNMSVEELKAYAEANKIEIGNATTKNGFLKKIRDAESKGES